jgi:Ca-activated chloride channel family protein
MSGRLPQLSIRTCRLLRTGVWAGAGVLVLALLQLLMAPQASPLLRADQQAAALLRQGQPLDAAGRFISTEWRAAATYAAGEFKQVAGMLVGREGAEAGYNRGNALAMQGLYQDAIPCFERALAARPEWDDASINLAVVKQLAKRTQRTGGEQLSEIGADEIKFDKRDPSKGGETQDEPSGAPLDDASMRAMWLRHVQTSPADFLRSKFAYQVAMEDVPHAK